MLFELLKRAFAYYVSKTTTYSALYGILASIPLFLFWLYLIWVVVLFGAHISFQSGSVSIFGGLRRYATSLGEVGSILGIRILQLITIRFKSGEDPITEGELAIETGSDPVLVRNCLDVLTASGLLTPADEDKHYRSMLKSPKTLTVDDVLEIFQSRGHFVGEKATDKEEQVKNNTIELFEKASKNSKKSIRNLTIDDLAELK